MSNPLLEDVKSKFPGILVTLPTKGQFYPEGVLEAVEPPPGEEPIQGEVHVGVLSMLDEQRYRDPFLMISGKAVHLMLRHVAPSVLEPEELAEIDVEVLLVAARIASYGEMMKIKHVCRNPETLQKAPEVVDTDGKVLEEAVFGLCEHENTVQVNLLEYINRYAPFTADERYELVLPRMGQTVFFQPVPYKTAREMMRYLMTKNRDLTNMVEKKVDEFIADPDNFDKYSDLLNVSSDVGISAIIDCITAVRTLSGKDVFDKATIKEWFKNLTNVDSEAITARINEITTEHRDLSLIEYECEKCKHRNGFNLQMNPETLFLADAEALNEPKMSSASPSKNGKRSKPRLKG